MPRPSIAPPPDAASLRAAALRYVARYATHSGRLQRVLERRLKKAALQHPEWAADTARVAALRELIGAIVTEFTAKNYLHDAGFAASKMRVLQQQGKARRFIVAALQQEGFESAMIEQAFGMNEAEQSVDPHAQDMAAARRLAQRKKLGRFGKASDVGGSDPDVLRRAYAAFARAGFSHSIAQQILQEELPEMMAEDEA